VIETRQIRVLVVDDHPFLREGIAAAIQGQKDMILVGEATNGGESLESFRRLRPDVTLMDIQMPGKNGIESMLAIRTEFPAARIVVLTASRGDVQVLKAFKAGALG
jgi:DNA-binding NarL/FixJ family response regulator